MRVELAPDELQRLVQQLAAIARIDPGKRFLETFAVQPDFAIRMEAAFGLQRQRLHPARHDERGVHGHAARVVEFFQLRRPQLRGQGQQGRGARRMAVLVLDAQQQRARRAMCVAIQSRPGTDQLVSRGTPRGE
jgi:hypothetical protein